MGLFPSSTKGAPLWRPCETPFSSFFRKNTSKAGGSPGGAAPYQRASSFRRRAQQQDKQRRAPAPFFPRSVLDVLTSEATRSYNTQHLTPPRPLLLIALSRPSLASRSAGDGRRPVSTQRAAHPRPSRPPPRSSPLHHLGTCFHSLRPVVAQCARRPLWPRLVRAEPRARRKTGAEGCRSNAQEFPRSPAPPSSSHPPCAQTKTR
jgi:hypothetical protein